MIKMRNLKKVTAVALAASMVLGGAMNVMAAETGDPVESEGSYEGGEMKYPRLKVTLPTVAKADYDYIADPNHLIADTAQSGDAARYKDSQFTGTTGIFFLTTPKDDDNPKNLYTEKSAAKTVTNENAQDIDVTVKLEQGSVAGDADITYASSSSFTGTDKELYLAVTDDTTTTALSSSAAAVVTATVNGTQANYGKAYDAATDSYGYKLKDEADLVDWQKSSFYLTGALNTGAEWGDNVKFPSIKVTWAYKATNPADEPQDAAPSVTPPAAYTLGDNTDLDIAYDLGAGELGASKVSDVVVTYNNALFSKYGAFKSSTVMSDNITIANGKITLSGGWLSYFPAGTYPICIVYDDESHTELINLVVQ